MWGEVGRRDKCILVSHVVLVISASTHPPTTATLLPGMTETNKYYVLQWSVIVNVYVGRVREILSVMLTRMGTNSGGWRKAQTQLGVSLHHVPQVTVLSTRV